MKKRKKTLLQLHHIFYISGIPVWVGQKLYTRYEKANKHKRNAFIVGGVTASVSSLNIIFYNYRREKEFQFAKY